MKWYLSASGYKYLSQHPTYLRHKDIANSACIENAAHGAMYAIHTPQGKHYGYILYAPGEHILGAILSTWDPYDAESMLGHIQRSLQKRIRSGIDPLYCRVLFGSADASPAWVLDRYNDVWVALVAHPIWHLLLQQHAIHLMRALAITCLIIKSSDKEIAPIIYGTYPPYIPVIEHGRQGYADPLCGQKTGWFYDQRANREALKHVVKHGHWLDICCYHGGFALAALQYGAEHITCVDRSSHALEHAQRAIDPLGPHRASYIVSDARTFLENAVRTAQRYDGVMCDPPCFLKGKKIRHDTQRAYQHWMRLCLDICTEDGIIVFSSCSSSVTLRLLTTWMTAVLKDARRSGRIIYKGRADRDHPYTSEEMDYLSCIIVQCSTS